MSPGSIVRRRSDPVHVGRIVLVNLSRGTCTVRWLRDHFKMPAIGEFCKSADWIEYLVPVNELERTVEWK